MGAWDRFPQVDQEQLACFLPGTLSSQSSLQKKKTWTEVDHFLGGLCILIFTPVTGRPGIASQRAARNNAAAAYDPSLGPSPLIDGMRRNS